ncbi:nuclear transport factor 2 family protein [Nonomuraea sp. NPDC049158]|uniref:nuclear transport factor 2 family protein n=1 Tax=Nonomuraea sp. NPDC049158 TaxID=3155649 RepID=UPI0034026412
MSTKSQARALLLAAVVPALLVTGCAAGGNDMRLMGAAASPMPSESGPSPAESDTGTMSPMPSESGNMSPEPSESASMAPMTTPRAAVMAFFDAAKAGEPDKAVEVFATDGMAAVEGKPTAQGTDALTTLFKELFKAKMIATHTIDETRMMGDVAFVRTTSTEGSEKYREFFLLKKSGGEWKIERYINNTVSE